MATRQQKREKIKKINNRIKEIKQKKKECQSNYNFDIEQLQQVVVVVKDKSSYYNRKYSIGIREFVLTTLFKIIEEMENDVFNDYNIKEYAKVLYQWATDPIGLFLATLDEIRNKVSKKVMKAQYESLKKASCTINKTERAILKYQMQSILAEYMMRDGIYDAHDYGSIRVCFQIASELIYARMPERKIKSLVLNVKYGDILDSIEIEYEDNDEKYNLEDNIVIFPIWNALDKLYKSYSIYKTDYRNFSDESINSLATAEEMYSQLQEREEDSSIVSYKGIAMSYLGVLEEELKRMVCKSYKLNLRKITFSEAIEYVRKGEFRELSDPIIIDVLDKMRILRNKAAHPGNTITENDIEYIKECLISQQILKFIDWDLTDLRLNR